MKTLTKKSELADTQIPTTLTLIPKQVYRKNISKFLSSKELLPRKSGLIRYVLLITLFLLLINLIPATNSLLLKIITSMFCGVVLSGLTFFMHDLMHGSVMRSTLANHITGITIGVFNLFPPLFWKKLHNFHHATTGSINDPDRNYVANESPKKPHEIFLYKLRVSNESINNTLCFLTISFGFISYFASNLLYGVFRNSSDLDIAIKYKGINKIFDKKERLFIFGELITIFAFQIVLFFILAKSSMINYLLISIVPILIAHFTTQVYIHTNHIMSPLTQEIDDPLINSLSIKNSKLVDKICSNFSHHVEHHLYPTASSAVYPKIRSIIENLYPERFNLLPMKKALSYLFNTPRIYADNYHLTNIEGSQLYPCLCRMQIK